MTVSIASDTFTRANQAAWGTASDGTDVWSVVLGGAANFSIATNEGQITGVTTLQGAYLGSKTATDMEGMVRFSPSAVSDAAQMFLRGTASNTQYRIRQTGTTFSILRAITGTATQLTSATFTTVAGSFYWIRARVVGTNLYAKIWADGSGEPAAWTLTTTDNQITTAGQFGLGAQLNVTTDTVKFDNFTVNQAYNLSEPTQVKFSTRTSLKGLVRSTFNTRTPLVTRTRDKFITAFSVRSMTRSRFLTRTGLSTQTRNRFITSISLRSLARSRFITSISLKTSTIGTFKIGIHLTTALRSTFKNNTVLLADWFKLVFGTLSPFIRLIFSGVGVVNLINFSDTFPITFKFGDPPLAQPNSSIQVSVTAMNASNVAIANLSVLTCVVTFPDGSVSPTYSIGSGIVNSGGGVYVLSYNTKSPGINSELWTATDTLGNTAQYQNRTSVTY